MTEYKPCPTSLPSNVRLSCMDGDPLPDMSRSVIEFELLETVELSSILEFIGQTEEFMKRLRMAKDLKIIGYEELTSSWQLNDDKSEQHLVSVLSFFIKRYSHLIQFHHFRSIQELHIYHMTAQV
ncbi:hypothetical protein L3X38_024859 [Prunus dulcis]|uniref:Uncharacterized protein n=1 Tax=Prunus dulcis TaxID=3755 RepID=A0AAD4W349_PRUDU|nr:hypothetical protein L3X38_024859 [Prunus dulcis]